jgi:hypothetical protein
MDLDTFLRLQVLVVHASIELCLRSGKEIRLPKDVRTGATGLLASKQ